MGAPFYILMGTWDKKRVVIVILISIVYGVWFDYLDSANGIGDDMGGNIKYQSWNIVGHMIPGLFMFLTYRKLELFLAGVLISTVVMDAPLWGVMKVDGHHQALWNPAPTMSITSWISFYYNPIGLYTVWNWVGGQPTAALMFWSMVARAGCAFMLIWYQDRLESQGKEFKLTKIYR